jgi:hypothetical protein
MFVTDCAILQLYHLLLKLKLCFMIPNCNWHANRLPVATGAQLTPLVTTSVQLAPLVAAGAQLTPPPSYNRCATSPLVSAGAQLVP